MRSTYLGSNDQLVANATLLGPLANERLRRLVLTTQGSLLRDWRRYEYVLNISRVDEVPAGVVEGLEKFETVLFVHRAHTNGTPLVTDAHGTKTNR